MRRSVWKKVAAASVSRDERGPTAEQHLWPEGMAQAGRRQAREGSKGRRVEGPSSCCHPGAPTAPARVAEGPGDLCLTCVSSGCARGRPPWMDGGVCAKVSVAVRRDDGLKAGWRSWAGSGFICLARAALAAELPSPSSIASHLHRAGACLARQEQHRRSQVPGPVQWAPALKAAARAALVGRYSGALQPSSTRPDGGSVSSAPAPAPAPAPAAARCFLRRPTAPAQHSTTAPQHHSTATP
jgi:hypothetical protein